VPVDEADVVARHIGPDLRELAAQPERRCPVLTGEQAVDPATQPEVEGAKKLLRHRPRPGPGRGADGGDGHAASCPRSIWGRGTAARTASSTVSALTPSASAS